MIVIYIIDNELNECFYKKNEWLCLYSNWKNVDVIKLVIILFV